MSSETKYNFEGKKLLLLLILLLLFLILTNLQAQQWQTLNNVCKSDLSSICYSSQNKTFVLEKEGMLLSTTNNGQSWKEFDLECDQALNSILFLNEMVGYIVGDCGKIFKTDLYGLIWSDISISEKYYLKDIAFSDPDNGVIVGAVKIRIFNDFYFSPVVLYTDNGGINWHDILFNEEGKLNSVAITSDLITIAVGDHGRIMISFDGGKKWSDIESPTTYNLNEVKICPDGRIIIVGDRGRIFNLEREKWSLIEMSTYGFYNLNSICFKQPNTIVVAGSKYLEGETSEETAIILQSTNVGASWDEIFHVSGNKFNSIVFCNPQMAFAAGSEGMIALYTENPLGQFRKEANLNECIQLANYPNPFNPSTKINWQSPVGSHQKIKIFDVLGNEVATLVDEYKPAGSYEVEFDASDLASGVYFYRLKAGNFIETKKMILLR